MMCLDPGLGATGCFYLLWSKEGDVIKTNANVVWVIVSTG